MTRAVAFGRLLRERGLRVTTGQIALFADALAAIDVLDRIAFHDVGRATLVSDADEIDAFEAAFARFWTRARQGDAVLPPPRVASLAPPLADAFEADARLTDAAPDASSPPNVIDRRLTWSASEVLRQTRFDRLGPEDARRVEALVRTLAWRIAPRRTRRYRSTSHGTLDSRRMDWRRMVRLAIRDQGEWLERRWRVRRTAPRPLVVLADISGSMEAYSRLLLGFLHGLTQDVAGRRGHRVEAFVFATRLTRITRALERRDVNAALDEVSARVVDWAGGTRIGDSLHAFNRDWARRVLGRGAVVLVISDGWDRGDPQRLACEVDRLQRSCYRLVWLNPLIGTEGYEPRTRGVVAALPFMDDFLPAHNLASLEDLARHLERLPAPRSLAAIQRPASSGRPAPAGVAGTGGLRDRGRTRPASRVE